MFSVLVAVVIGVADQVAKALVLAQIPLYQQNPVIPGFFNLVFVRNTGAAWGTFSGGNRWLAILSISMLIAIVVARRSIFTHGRLGRWTAGLLAGGILGNLIDRVRLGYVVDFLDFHVGQSHFPSFNIADSAICVGVALYMLAQWLEWRREKALQHEEDGGGGVTVSAAHFLVGPTASGKSAVAQVLAERAGAGILSADSMLVYKGLDIGTAKPSLDERGAVPYWGLDLVEPNQLFSVYDYTRAVQAQLDDVDRPVIVVGGTGLYVKGLVLGLDPQRDSSALERDRWSALHAAEGVPGLQAALEHCAPGVLATLADPKNPRRLIRALERAADGGVAERVWDVRQQTVPVVGLQVDPGVLSDRIIARVDLMYAGGLATEVEQLLASGVTLARTAAQAIGYAEAIDYVCGNCTLDEAKGRTVVRTRQLAKRQRTWFRHQVVTEWVEAGAGDDPERIADRVGEVWGRYGTTPIRWD